MTISAAHDGTASTGILLTSNAAGHQKGSYVELIASLGFDARWIEIEMRQSPIAQKGVIDIAIGTTVVIPDLLTPNIRTGGFTRVRIPKKFASGSQIQARYQNENALQTILVGVRLGSEGPLPTINTITALNFTSGSTDFTAIDPGGVANTKPATFTTLIASTAANYDGLIVAIALDNATIGAEQDWLVDIATGAASSEVVIIPDIWVIASVALDGIPSNVAYYSHAVPSGTRLSARAQCTSIDATDRILDDVAIYGYVNNSDLPVAGGAATLINGGLIHP